MDTIVNNLGLGDITDVLQKFENLTGNDFSPQMIEKRLVDKICDIITRYSVNTFIPIGDAEKLLSLIGRLMDAGGDDGLGVFAEHARFIENVISLIEDFSIRLTTLNRPSNAKFSFKSHYCYELALFILLGIVEKSALIKAFVRSTSPESMKNLVSSISAVICGDYLYITQVCASIDLSFIVSLLIRRKCLWKLSDVSVITTIGSIASSTKVFFSRFRLRFLLP
jgi:hypothetical protein